MSLDVFIGYDPREAVAFHTCVNSIIRHSSQPVTIHPLALANLQGYTEGHRDGSNDFIYSRFLVPYLMRWRGKALYIDGDMVVTDDIAKLFDLGGTYTAVNVVKHNYKTKSQTKYFGQTNEDYPRKNWSSVILWNCTRFEHRKLTPEFVEQTKGAYLHRFAWLTDDLIGGLPIEWNWLPDEYGDNYGAKLLHWTLGIPALEGCENTPMADVWTQEMKLATHAERGV